MKRIIGQKKTARLALLMLAAALLCSGCLGRSGGGVHTAKGMTLIEAGDCEGALKEFETAILEGEDEVPAYRGQGIAYMGLDHCEEAAVSFDMALSYTDRKMDKTRQDILLYKASACCRSGSYEEARDACDKLLEQDETLTEALFLRGVACLGLGQQEQARTAFDAAGASSLSASDGSRFTPLLTAPQRFTRRGNPLRTPTGTPFMLRVSTRHTAHTPPSSAAYSTAGT